jgi:hypothetical protein
MVRSHPMGAFGDGAQVFEPFETSPDSGGGPIRRTPLLAVRANAGNMVYRTPHAVVPDAEPGGAYEPQLWADKFLPDGRVVPQSALGVSTIPHNTRVALFTLATAVLGAGLGAVLEPSSRAKGALIGGGVAGLLGVLASLGGGEK